MAQRRAFLTSNSFLTVAGYREVGEYGLNSVVAVAMLLVSRVVSSVVVSDVVVEVVGVVEVGVSGGNNVAVELPVVVNVDVEVVVPVRRTLDDDVADDDVMNDGLEGCVECRDVCSTANTMRTTARTPAIPAAIATPGRSCH
jgi:hypothetical protein